MNLSALYYTYKITNKKRTCKLTIFLISILVLSIERGFWCECNTINMWWRVRGRRCSIKHAVTLTTCFGCISVKTDRLHSPILIKGYQLPLTSDALTSHKTSVSPVETGAVVTVLMYLLYKKRLFATVPGNIFYLDNNSIIWTHETTFNKTLFIKNQMNYCHWLNVTSSR